MDALRRGLSDFAAALGRRFGLGVHSTEDAIRYTFFVSILRELECGPERLILEYPHPARGRALIDAWIVAAASEPAVALEFKFHRPIVGATTNQPRTMHAGSVLADIFKLALIGDAPPVRRVVAYVCGPEMAGYFRNHANGLQRLFELPYGSVLALDEAYLAGRSATLQRAAGAPCPCRVSMLYAGSVDQFYEIRAFEVRPGHGA